MFSASQLSEDQKEQLRQWAAEGDSIADLQKRMREEMNLGVTYMDARFVVLDLGIEIVDEKALATEAAKAAEAAKEEPQDGGEVREAEVEVEPPLAGGGISVTMDQVAMPGALVSGKVTFSDGEKAVWMLDEYGRPGLDPETPGYRPAKEDIEAFQKQLTTLVRDAGI